MIIRRIRLHNIRSYRDADIVLKNGTLLFEGDIGSGKTSLLMAIEFALFGTTEGGFYEKILRKGANEGYAEITFEHDGGEYTIYRSLRKRGRGIRSDESHIITPAGKKLISSSEIKSHILGLMGVRVSTKKRKSLPIITYAIYTPQETMKSILEGSDEERMEVIRRIFRIDDYKIARDNANIIRNRIRGEIEYLERRKGDLENVKKEIENLRAEIESIEGELRILEEQREEKKRELESMERRRREWEERRKQYENLAKEKERLKALLGKFMEDIKKDERELEEMKEKKRRMEEIEEDARRYESITGRISEIKGYLEKLHELEKELRGYAERLKIIREKERILEKLKKEEEEVRRRIEELAKIARKREGIEKDYEEARAKEKILFGMLEHNRKKLEELEEERREYESLGGVCPKCKRPLTKEHKQKLISEVDEEIEKARRNIKSIEEKRRKIEEEMRRLKDNIEELNKKERELSARRKEFLMLKRSIEEAEKEIGKGREIEKREERERKEREKLKVFEDEYRTLEEERNKIERIWREYIGLSRAIEGLGRIKSRMEEERRKIDELSKKLSDINRRMESLNFSEEEYGHVEEEYRKLREKLREIETAMGEKRNHLEEKRVERRRKEERREKIEEDIEWGEKLLQFNTWLEKQFIPSLEDIERSALMSINEQFRVLFERWFNDLLGESDYDATIDENFRPVIRYERYDMPISTLSGGERTSVALAYRLALNSMVKRALGLKTNLLILDEPTDGFSKDQLYKLKDILGNTEADQIIIVSHERELENIADSIYYVNKKNGVSEIRVL